MSWNYRILATRYNEEDSFEICEVYYDKNDNAHSYAGNVNGPTGSDLEDLKKDWELMGHALEKPILWSGEKFPQEYKQ